MELKAKEQFKDLKNRIDRPDRESIKHFREQIDINSGDITAFLCGVAVTMLIITAISLTGLLGNPFLDSDESSIEVLPPEEAGNKTVEMLNQRVLHNTPNNVTGELKDVKPANTDILPEFYEVEMIVKNPSSQQVTTVYAKKDASVVFLNHPRYFDPEDYRNQEHQ